jgi:hypothetical protein
VSLRLKKNDATFNRALIIVNSSFSGKKVRGHSDASIHQQLEWNQQQGCCPKEDFTVSYKKILSLTNA